MNPKTFSHPELIKKLPAEVKTIFRIFGDEIRLVGGSVRDLLLGKKVNDFDFCTKFSPDQITKVLTKNKIKAIPTGIKFGTITAVVAGKNFEITTLRKDVGSNGRHSEVEFVADYFEDAARRDFTINALYLDSAGSVTDYFGGIDDLSNKKLRFIGEASRRIEEDFLRILRFFRFSCEYAVELDAQGLAACVKAKESLKKLSRERLRAEVLKIISTAEKENLVAVLKVLKDKKIAESFFSSELDVKALTQLFELEERLKFSASPRLKIAALFLRDETDLDIFAKEICATNLEKKFFYYVLNVAPVLRVFKRTESQEILKQFQDDVSRDEIAHHPPRYPELVLGALAGDFNALELGLEDLKQLLAFADKNLVLDLYLLSLVKNPDSTKNSDSRKNLKFLQNFSLPNFPLGGEDVIDLGFTGKAAGKAIESAKKFWAANDFSSDKAALQKFLKTK